MFSLAGEMRSWSCKEPSFNRFCGSVRHVRVPASTERAPGWASERGKSNGYTRQRSAPKALVKLVSCGPLPLRLLTMSFQQFSDALSVH